LRGVFPESRKTSALIRGIYQKKPLSCLVKFAGSAFYFA
jgi:hypothetical protein